MAWINESETGSLNSIVPGRRKTAGAMVYALFLLKLVKELLLYIRRKVLAKLSPELQKHFLNISAVP